jgi:arylsulfatase A-like enzyme
MQIDDHIGQLVDTLKKQGVYEDTIFIFTTDNGTSPRTDIPQLNEHGHDPSGGLRGRKADIYEGGHRVPYIVTWSNGGVKPNSISHEVICLTDLIATCAEIVGVKLDDADAVDSVSHLAAMRGEKSPALRKGIVHHSLDGSFAIRSGDWKLIFCASAGAWKYSDLTSEEAQKQGLPDYQLYNLKDDLAETKNLYNKHPDKMCELTALMAEIISKGRSTPGAPQANTGETPFLPHEEKMSQIKKINLVD